MTRIEQIKNLWFTIDPNSILRRAFWADGRAVGYIDQVLGFIWLDTLRKERNNYDTRI